MIIHSRFGIAVFGDKFGILVDEFIDYAGQESSSLYNMIHESTTIVDITVSDSDICNMSVSHKLIATLSASFDAAD